MSSVNKVTLIGRLGKDPELKYTQSGTAVASLVIATSESYKDKAGNQKEETEWHKVNVWNRQGENASKYLSKGSLVYVEGRIKTNTWQDKNGEKRYSTEIFGERIKFLDSKKDGGSTPAPAPANNPSTSLDDIPF